MYIHPFRFSHDAATTLGMGNFSTPLCIGVGTDLEFDATMAHIDMEDFQSQDILLRLPPLCASDLQVRSNYLTNNYYPTLKVLSHFYTALHPPLLPLRYSSSVCLCAGLCAFCKWMCVRL